MRILGGGKPLQKFDAVDKCRLYFTTMNVMNFQIDIRSIPIVNFQNQQVLAFYLRSEHNATQNCQNPDLVRQPLRLQLFFFLKNTLVNSLYWKNEHFWLQLTLFCCSKNWNKGWRYSPANLQS